MKNRVFVIEDHPLMRRSIVEALEREPELMVCGYLIRELTRPVVLIVGDWFQSQAVKPTLDVRRLCVNKVQSAAGSHRNAHVLPARGTATRRRKLLAHYR